MKKIKVGFVGWGYVAKSHVLAVSELSDLFVANAVVDTDNERRHEVEKTLGIPTFGNIDEMISNSNLDLVVIMSPDHYHYAQTITALKASKDVFSEKPMALLPAHCNEIKTSVDEKGLIYMINHSTRQYDYYKLFRELCLPLLTDLSGVSFSAGYIHDMRGVFSDDKRTFQRHQNALLGGGVFPLDLILWFFPGTSVADARLNGYGYKKGANTANNNPNWYNLFVSLSNGITGSIEVDVAPETDDYRKNVKVWMQIKKDGNILSETLPDKLLVGGNITPKKRINPSCNPFKQQYIMLASAVHSRIPPKQCNVLDALNATYPLTKLLEDEGIPTYFS